MFIRRKQCCVNCRFFQEEGPTQSGEPYVLPVSHADRQLARQDDFSWTGPPARLACSFGVWDEWFDSPRKDRYKIIVQTNRRNFCFWWRYHPGMLNPAAKILQERDAKNRELFRDRLLTILGLWIAAVALLANIWLSIAKEVRLWPFR